jgi:hypothetical protein
LRRFRQGRPLLPQRGIETAQGARIFAVRWGRALPAHQARQRQHPSL